MPTETMIPSPDPLRDKVAALEARAREAEAEVVRLRTAMAQPVPSFCIHCGARDVPNDGMVDHSVTCWGLKPGSAEEKFLRLAEHATLLRQSILYRDLALLHARYALLDLGLTHPVVEALTGRAPEQHPGVAEVVEQADDQAPAAREIPEPTRGCEFCRWAHKVLSEVVGASLAQEAMMREGVRRYRAMVQVLRKDAAIHTWGDPPDLQRARSEMDEWERTSGRDLVDPS